MSRLFLFLYLAGDRSGFSYSGRFLLHCLLLFMITFLNSNVFAAPLGGNSSNASQKFETSLSCKNCHQNIYLQFAESMHSKSFANSLFRKMFFEDLLPRYAEDETLEQEVKQCIACHSPVTFVKTEGNIFAEQHVDPDFAGVECDLCHRIEGYNSEKPHSGNFIAQPGQQKFGPFKHDSTWHHVYAELQTKSEFCAICHDRVNRYGLEIKSTYSEWKNSRYAEMGIQCQDCHMNVNGFLTGGKPVYESGKAARATLINSTVREKLYTHRFPGAHSETQVSGAITLRIQADESAMNPGHDTIIYVTVDNSRSGHKLPTGSAELRLAYLDVYAQVGDRIIPLPANSLNGQMFDVAGRGTYDEKILGNTFQQGRRIYRAVCVDSEGKQTMYSYDAQNIIFDNRLQADEIRKEFFDFSIPEDAGSGFTLVAKLYYLRYPDSFAAKIGVEKAKLIELASARKDIVLEK